MEPDRGLEEFFAPQVLESLAAVDRAWHGPLPTGAFETAARGLVLLRLQTLDRLDISDPLSGRALAVLALAKARGSENLHREEVLLAERLGYEGDARALAAALAPEDPIRAFAMRDDAALLTAAEGSADRLVQYLAALRLAEQGNVATWSSWIQTHQAMHVHVVMPSLIGAALEADEFDSARLLPVAMRTASYWELLSPAEKQGLDLTAKGLTSDEVSSEIAQFTEAVWKKLALDEEKLLRSFEVALSARAAKSRGPIVDEVLVRSYFGSNFYSGLYETARFLHDQFGSEQEASRFASSLGQPLSLVAKDLKRWIEDRSDVYAARKPPTLLLTDIRELRSIGLAPILRMRSSADQYLSAQLVERRRMARDIFLRLDSRPAFLVEAAPIAYYEVQDPRLRDRLMAIAVSSAPRQSGSLLEWYAQLGKKMQVLKEIADRSDLKPETRSQALGQLARADPAEQDYVELRFRDLMARYPDRSSVITDYAAFEENRRGAESANQLLQDWLRKNSKKQDLNWIHDATWLSERLQAQGKLQQALEVVAPLVDSGKSETVAQAASVLEALGQHKAALEMARDNLGRYPTSGYAAADLAEILWRQSDYAGAAELLQSNDKYLPPSTWYGTVSVAFAKAFVKSPLDDTLRAFGELSARGFMPQKLASLGHPLAERGRHDIALAISQKAPPPAQQTIYDWIATYREMKQVTSASEATEWMRQKISPPAFAEQASTAFYYEGEFDLLWSIVPAIGNPAKNNMLKMFRAASLVRTRANEADSRWRQLVADLEEPGASRSTRRLRPISHRRRPGAEAHRFRERGHGSLRCGLPDRD